MGAEPNSAPLLSIQPRQFIRRRDSVSWRNQAITLSDPRPPHTPHAHDAPDQNQHISDKGGASQCQSRAKQPQHNTTQLGSNSTPAQRVAQLNSAQHETQLNSTARAKRARRASRCQRHLLLKVASSCQLLLLSYYDVSFQSSLSPNPSNDGGEEGKEHAQSA
jgi:hypothetical protein